MTTLEKILVPAAEAAAMLSMGKSTFWREVAKGVIPEPIKFGGLTRWRVADLHRFADGGGCSQATIDQNGINKKH